MVTIDPAHFVVRRDSYNQNEFYPETCAQLCEELITRKPATFSQAYELVSSKIEESAILNRDWTAKHAGELGFGKARLDPAVRHWTSFGMSRAADADDVRARFPKPRLTTITHPNPDERGEPIPLSAIETRAGVVQVVHPDVSDIKKGDFSDEKRWSLISQEYTAAFNTGLAQPARKEASLTCYALLSHDCPNKRGSATLANIMLHYLAHEVGFKVEFAKADVDLNTKAISRDVPQFLKEWAGGNYFDTRATSEDVMAWHNRRASKALAHI